MKKSFLVFIIIFILNFFTPLSCIPILASESKDYIIFIDVNSLTLSLVDSQTNKFEKTYPIAIGSKDTPSPIGTWQITALANRNGPFGGYWLGLNVPWDVFGIHGTSRPDSIGSLASGGCFRMYNHNIKEIFDLVHVGTIVIVYPGPSYQFSPYYRTVKPHNRGTDVYHIQRTLNGLGYYNDVINGIYDYSLEIAILKYKKDFNLPGDTEADKPFLESIGHIKFE